MMGTNRDWSIAIIGCALLVLVVSLKLWAAWWLYHFVATWIATGIVPGFWSFVWALLLVGFLFAPARFSSSSKD